MDFMTILGLLAGVASIYYVMMKGEILHILWNLEALILVFGGTLASILISYPWPTVKRVPGALRIIFFPQKNLHPQEVIKILVQFSEKAKRAGIETLQNDIHQLKDKFLVNSIQMLIDGTELDLLRDNLEREVIHIRERHQKIGSVFRAMATLAPVFGLLGTLIGVIQVLRNITEPAKMGPAMAIAIVSTFYGIFGANFLFLPAAIKLNEYSEEEILTEELIIEGTISIHQGELPLVLSKKLETFLSVKLRESTKK